MIMMMMMIIIIIIISMIVLILLRPARWALEAPPHHPCRPRPRSDAAGRCRGRRGRLASRSRPTIRGGAACLSLALHVQRTCSSGVAKAMGRHGIGPFCKQWFCLTLFRGSCLSNATSLAQVFFKRGEECGNLWRSLTQRKTQHKWGRIRQVAVDR